MAETKTYATGKKKSAIARVWLQPGDGKMTINKQPADQYFGRPTLVQLIQEPLGVVEKIGAFDILARVVGGGKAGQAAAVRHGLAKALSSLDGQMRSPLKKAGMLTRDARVKERKKYGQPGARKRYQYSKR